MNSCLARARYRSLCAAAALLGVLAFWCGLWMAARRYPSEYDWRFITISRLGYADRNPDGYRLAWGGLMLCGIGGLCWTAALLRDFRGAGERPRWGIWALVFGYFCMVNCAWLPGGFPLAPRGHDFLAVSAFLGLCVGILQLTYHATRRNPRLRDRAFPGAPRLRAALLVSVAVSPILIAAITQAYLSHARPDLPWVGLEWRARGAPVYLSFAFWEWVTCAIFSVYSVVLCLVTMMPREITEN